MKTQSQNELACPVVMRVFLQEAVERGAGDGWLDVLPMTPCPPPLEGSVVVDASPLVPRRILDSSHS